MPEILDRLRNLSKSVVASWEGHSNLKGEALLAHLKLRWKGIPFRAVWRCGQCNFFRPSSNMSSPGAYLVRKEDCGESKQQFLLHGIPVVWRTEWVLRKIVEPFGYLLNFTEISSAKKSCRRLK
ncbi:hypothetical protein QJS10_CPB12g00514 [Acorus calamus]|uniref:Uncharacterized protein n=1 Tax=Acorus calamus TaxID=4465 RepID=A0AAV9DL64_ACOCL|nr:hypothetical protein QJS10_CPB12g00514 [Acorus calamus]